MSRFDNLVGDLCDYAESFFSMLPVMFVAALWIWVFALWARLLTHA